MAIRILFMLLLSGIFFLEPSLAKKPPTKPKSSKKTSKPRASSQASHTPEIFKGKRIKVKKFEVLQSDCPIKIYQSSSKSWKDSSKLFGEGQTVYGFVAPGSDDTIIFKESPRAKELYGGKRSCTFKKRELLSSSKAKIVAAPSAEESEGIQLSGPTPHHLYMTLGVFSWQEPLTLKSATSSVHVIENSLGASLGGGWDYQFKWFQLGFQVNGFFAASEAGLKGGTDTGSITSYRVQNAMVYGLKVGPDIFFRPFSGSVAFGFHVPVVLRYGNWPSNNTGTWNIQEKFSIYPLPMIEARVEIKKIFISQQIGLYRSFSTIAWFLQGGWRFL